MEQRSVGVLTLVSRNLPDPVKPNLSSRFHFAFEREERANNHQKQNTATSSARSASQLKVKTE